jgi:hypothetical protein
MASDADQLSGQTPNALGGFHWFLGRVERPSLRVPDTESGRGRDAISLAQRGHRVVGVENGWGLVADEPK